MIINWQAVMDRERRQFGALGEAEKFAYFLLLQYGSPYGWGKENPEASDCSGAVCLALYAATGLLIRATADELFTQIFTVRNSGPGTIRAAFFLTGREKREGGRVIPAGQAVHVAGLVDEGVVLNSQEPGARVRRLADVGGFFFRDGCIQALRGLDRGALVAAAAAGRLRSGVDAELEAYFTPGKEAA